MKHGKRESMRVVEDVMALAKEDACRMVNFDVTAALEWFNPGEPRDVAAPGHLHADHHSLYRASFRAYVFLLIREWVKERDT